MERFRVSLEVPDFVWNWFLSFPQKARDSDFFLESTKEFKDAECTEHTKAMMIRYIQERERQRDAADGSD